MAEIPRDCFIYEENGSIKKLARVNFVKFLER